MYVKGRRQGRKGSKVRSEGKSQKGRVGKGKARVIRKGL